MPQRRAQPRFLTAVGSNINQSPASPARSSVQGGAAFVAAGIFLSRIAGLIRESIFAHYFGASTVADAFKAALRIPNFLQNLFGEGVLSASFVPVYAKLVATGEEDLRRRVASAVAAIVTLAAAVLSLCGVIFASWLVDVITPGFAGETRDMCVQLVRIFFPGTAVLVCSAWCLGVLNSHRRFFLPYVSPVVWNGAIIAALVTFGSREESEAVIHVAWGVTIGSFLQFLVQLPTAVRLVGGLVPTLGVGVSQVGVVIRNFIPVFVGRGVVQVSAFIDTIIASFLPAGSFATLAYAQNIYLLPIGLFGMSVSVVELTQMSQTLAGHDGDGAQAKVLERLGRAQRQILFFVTPTAAVFLVLGSEVISALYQTGRFSAADTRWVWLALAGLTIGLIASTLGRLYASVFYSLHDSKTPLKFALIRVAFSTSAGYLLSIHLPGHLGIDPRYGIVFLAAAAGTSSWIEWYLLRRAVSRTVGPVPPIAGYFIKTGGAAAAAAATAVLIERGLIINLHLVREALVLGVFGISYLGLAAVLKVDEVKKFGARFRNR